MSIIKPEVVCEKLLFTKQRNYAEIFKIREEIISWDLDGLEKFVREWKNSRREMYYDYE